MEIEEVMKYLPPIFVGFISAYFGSMFAFKKFKSEKLWDERRAIYKEVIEAFEELGGWAEYMLALNYCEPTIDVEFKFDEPLRVISKRSVIGRLFLSKAFYKTLEEADLKLRDIRFRINEECQPDMDSDRGRSEWLVILATQIKGLVDDYLPKLLSIAKDEIPK